MRTSMRSSMRGRANKVTKPKRSSRTPSAVPESVNQGVDYLAAAAHDHKLINHHHHHQQHTIASKTQSQEKSPNSAQKLGRTTKGRTISWVNDGNFAYWSY